MATTKQSNLITPEVLGAYLDVKLIDAIKLTPFMEVDRTLQGRAGDVLTLPKYAYIGEADDLDEGETMVPVALQASTVTVQVKKIAKAVEITDEAIMNHYGDAVNEIGKQLLVAIADKIEMDCFDELAKAKLSVAVEAFDKEALLDAQLQFGEDLEDGMVVFVRPSEFNALRKDKDFVHVEAGARIVSGHYGKVFGVDVIVSNRVAEGEAYLIKRGALALIAKQNCQCEQDRNILNMTNVYTAHEFYVPYLKYEDRAVKIAIGSVDVPPVVDGGDDEGDDAGNGETGE